MTLNMLEQGRRAVIQRIDGGNGRRNNLLDLGIVPGVPVKIIQSAKHGPLVIEVLGSRIILGKGLASSVTVA